MASVDFEEREVFGHNENKIVPPEARKHKLDQAKSVTNYENKLKEMRQKLKFEERTSKSVQKIEDGLTSRELMTELDELDSKRTRHMSKAEGACCPFYSGNVTFSVTVDMKGASITFLNLATKHKRASEVSKKQKKGANQSQDDFPLLERSSVKEIMQRP